MVELKSLKMLQDPNIHIPSKMETKYPANLSRIPENSRYPENPTRSTALFFLLCIPAIFLLYLEFFITIPVLLTLIYIVIVKVGITKQSETD